MSRTGALDQLPQIQELNRAFLGLLQTRLRQQRSCFGLPLGARLAVTAASPALLDGVASFPRALFELDLTRSSRVAPTPTGMDCDEAERELCLSILFIARSMSRHSAYQARLLFDLEAAAVERLRTAPFNELQRLACMPGVLQCAFRERHWFWLRLLTTTRPEVRRQLTLMALQPRSGDWPVRRPPRVTA